KHVPLIKFLGPRNKLPKVDNTPKPHPAAPKGSGLPSTSQEAIASNRSVNQKLVIEYSELPEKYKRKGLTFEEIETIDSGGAYLINS
ncbi:10174_t:CDS:2, partial [Dentiscutata heterogama]